MLVRNSILAIRGPITSRVFNTSTPLHVDLVGDQGLGPTWFYEGFAVVAAGQCESASLSNVELGKVIRSENKGRDSSFGFAIRYLIKKYMRPKLVELARLDRKKFLMEIGYPIDRQTTLSSKSGTQRR